MKQKTIQLEYPYEGTGSMDIFGKNIKMSDNSCVNFISYERYLYDVKIGRRSTMAEYDAYVTSLRTPSSAVNPFLPMHEKIVYRASNELTLEEKRELFVKGL